MQISSQMSHLHSSLHGIPPPQPVKYNLGASASSQVFAVGRQMNSGFMFMPWHLRLWLLASASEDLCDQISVVRDQHLHAHGNAAFSQPEGGIQRRWVKPLFTNCQRQLMYRNRRGLRPVTSNHICTYNAAYIDQCTCAHVPARAQCCDWCVFWHRVSEIARHAQRHAAPHKAAATNVADMSRQAGSYFSMFLPLEFCELDPPLVSNSPQDHNHMTEMKPSPCGVLSWQIEAFPTASEQEEVLTNAKSTLFLSVYSCSHTLSVFFLTPNL